MNPEINDAAIRPAAVAGMFYPADALELGEEVDTLLGSAPRPPFDAASIKAIAVPHAGYVYSGATAAAAYRLLEGRHAAIRRVVLLGPTHRVAVRGLALPNVDIFETPLGGVPVDTELAARIERLPQVVGSRAAHAAEHSLEVQLPFLQRVIGEFSLLPLAVGMVRPEDVAEAIDAVWGGAETLIVVSTDLSHFLSYATAQGIDSATCRQILALDGTLRPDQACGAYPVNGLLLAARRAGLEPALVGLCNSGDTAGDRNRVVGYAAFAFHSSEPPRHA